MSNKTNYEVGTIICCKNCDEPLLETTTELSVGDIVTENDVSKLDEDIEVRNDKVCCPECDFPLNNYTNLKRPNNI